MLCSALPGCSAHSNQGSFGSYLPFYFCEMSHADLLMGTFLPPCSATKTVISSAAIPDPASPGPHCYLWWLGEEPPEFTQSLPDTHTERHTAAFQTPPAHVVLSTWLLSEHGNLICRITLSTKYSPFIKVLNFFPFVFPSSRQTLKRTSKA